MNYTTNLSGSLRGSGATMRNGIPQTAAKDSDKHDNAWHLAMEDELRAQWFKGPLPGVVAPAQSEGYLTVGSATPHHLTSNTYQALATAEPFEYKPAQLVGDRSAGQQPEVGEFGRIQLDRTDRVRQLDLDGWPSDDIGGSPPRTTPTPDAPGSIAMGMSITLPVQQGDHVAASIFGIASSASSVHSAATLSGIRMHDLPSVSYTALPAPTLHQGNPCAHASEPNEFTASMRTGGAKANDAGVPGASCPVRVHSSWNGEAFAVWIGHDIGHETSVAMFVQALRRRWMEDDLPRGSIVVNGRSLAGDPSGVNGHDPGDAFMRLTGGTPP